MYVFNTNSKINSSDIYVLYLPDHLHHKVHYFPSRHQFFQLCMYIYSHIMLAWPSVRNLPHLQGKINTLSLKVCEKEFVTFANWTILQYHSFSGYNFLFSLPRLHLFAAIGMIQAPSQCHYSQVPRGPCPNRYPAPFHVTYI